MSGFAKLGAVFGRCAFVALLFVSACGGATAESTTQDGSSESAEAAASASMPTATPVPAPTASPPSAAPTSSAASEPQAQPEPTTTPEARTRESPTSEPSATPEETTTPEQVETDGTCRVIDDFEDDSGRWQVVLDGVMGGRSSGQAVVGDGTLELTGTINTNGGGFVMVRRQIRPADMDGATSLRFVAAVDGRRYEVILDDALPGRNRSVSHFATIDFAGADGSDNATGTVLLSELESRSFGNRISTESFRPDLAFSIGVILSDGVDGDFVIRLDRIEACR